MVEIGVTRLGLRALRLGLELWEWNGSLEAQIVILRLGLVPQGWALKLGFGL